MKWFKIEFNTQCCSPNPINRKKNHYSKDSSDPNLSAGNSNYFTDSRIFMVYVSVFADRGTWKDLSEVTDENRVAGNLVMRV